MIQFLLNGSLVQIDGGIPPTKSVLNYLRENQQLTGSKEGCAEGDCGACTVVVGELQDNQLQMRSVNACIQLLPTLNGKALFTVEYLRQLLTEKSNSNSQDLHPVQQAMVDHHGAQCGFCTPGFVMSLWGVYLDHQPHHSQPGDTEIRTALSGNLCRCTGYKPILTAAAAMMDYPEIEFDRATTEQQLRAIRSSDSLSYQHQDQHFFAPQSLQELSKLRARLPDATLLAGSTDIGLWVNKMFRDLGDIIYLGEVRELKHIEDSPQTITIGAGVSLNEAFAHIAEHYPQIEQQWQRFASTPIRNAGTLGGNIANGSPLGDSMPWLMVLGTEISLRSQRQQRIIPLQDLYLGYMQKDLAADEIIESIIIPKPHTNQLFRSYKLAKRYDSDISAVCAAFSIDLQDDLISSARVAFGGMAATPKRAQQTEQALMAKPWNEATVKQAMRAMSNDYSPMSDMRASADYRLEAAQNLLYRFYLETRPQQPLQAAQLSVFET